MTETDKRVDSAVQLAIKEYGAEVLETVRKEIAEFRRELQGNYRTAATCDAKHAGLPRDMATEADVEAVDHRVTELRGWVWGIAVAALFSLGTTVVGFLS